MTASSYIRPPKYPKIPYLVAPAHVQADDGLLSEDERRGLVAATVVVEEKLDGANVSLWFDGATLQVATRGGLNAMDRGGLLGRLRAWALERRDYLYTALDERLVLYGEWLLRRHRIHYSRLPSALIGLDVLNAATSTFLDVPGRDRVLAAACLCPPPVLFDGVLHDLATAENLLGRSRFADEMAEGIVVRPVPPLTGLPRIAKLVRRDFVPVGDNPSEENTVLES